MAGRHPVHRIRLGAQQSIDFVDVISDQIILFVIAERGAIDRRTVARLPYDEVRGLMRFLEQRISAPRKTGEFSPLTKTETSPGAKADDEEP